MKRLSIGRLELDLHGIAPDTAKAAARALGPALARALTQRCLHAAPAERIDAGRIASAAAPDAGSLATQIAQRIAQTISDMGAPTWPPSPQGGSARPGEAVARLGSPTDSSGG
jgi:hypothetical protein